MARMMDGGTDTRRGGLAALAFMLALGTLAGGAHAEGTLDKIKRRGQINLGYRVDAAPFSYVDAKKNAVGYSVDMCGEVVARLRAQMGSAPLQVKLVPVDIDRAVRFVSQGSVDLLCSSTSDTAERRGQLAFSKPIFFDGVGVMVRQKDGIGALEALQGKDMVAINTSTAVQTLERFNRERAMQWKIAPALNADAAFSALQLGWAAGYARDAVPLALQRAGLPNAQDYVLLPAHLSVETIAIAMPRGDEALRAFVDDTLAEAAASGKAEATYAKWFTQPIVYGGRKMTLAIPMSAELRTAFAAAR